MASEAGLPGCDLEACSLFTAKHGPSQSAARPAWRGGTTVSPKASGEATCLGSGPRSAGLTSEHSTGELGGRGTGSTLL